MNEATRPDGPRARPGPRRRLPGRAEVAAESVQVTDVAAGFNGVLKAASFLRLVKDAYQGRRSNVDWLGRPL